MQDPGSLTRDWTWASCIRRWGLNHWTTREVPLLFFNKIKCPLYALESICLGSSVSLFWCWKSRLTFSLSLFACFFFHPFISISLSVFLVESRLPWWLSVWRICVQRRPGRCRFDQMAARSSVLAWKMPWTEKPGGLQPTGSQRVRHDSAHTQAARIHRARFLLIPLRVSVFCLEPPPHLYCT